MGWHSSLAHLKSIQIPRLRGCDAYLCDSSFPFLMFRSFSIAKPNRVRKMFGPISFRYLYSLPFKTLGVTWTLLLPISVGTHEGLLSWLSGAIWGCNC